MSDGPSKEARILMAIDAIRSGEIKSLRIADTTFRVSKTSINNRMNGKFPATNANPTPRFLIYLKRRYFVNT